jgi:hypothetical protein
VFECPFVKHGCAKSLPSRYSNTEIRPASNRRILLIEQVWPSATSEVLFNIRVLYEREERSMGSSNTVGKTTRDQIVALAWITMTVPGLNIGVPGGGGRWTR